MKYSIWFGLVFTFALFCCIEGSVEAGCFLGRQGGAVGEIQLERAEWGLGFPYGEGGSRACPGRQFAKSEKFSDDVCDDVGDSRY